MLRLYYRHRRDLLVLALLLALTLAYYWQIALGGHILIDYDVFTYFYPHYAYAAQQLRSGHLPLWNPYLFTGVPFLANLQTALFYPPNLLFLFLPVPYAYSYSVVLHIFLAGSFTYAFARGSLALDRLSSFVVAVIFAFGGFAASLVGHLNQLHAAAWMPLLLLLLDMAYQRRRSPTATRLGEALWAVPAGLALGLQFTAGHAQVSYLTLVALGLFLLFRIATDTAGTVARRLAGAALLLAATLLTALGLAAVQLVPAYELLSYSIRAGGMGYEEATSFSLPPWMVLRSLLPGYGDASPFSEWLAYVGVAGLVLALVAITKRPLRRSTLFFGLLALLALFLAFGKYNPLYHWFYQLVPGMDMFRVPARWLYLYSLAMAVLAGEGTSCLTMRRRELAIGLSQWLLWLIGAGLLLVFLYVFFRSPVAVERPSFATGATWVALGAITTAVVALGVVRSSVSAWAAAVVTVLLVGELFAARQNLSLNRPNLPEAYWLRRPAINYFTSQEGLYRVLALSDNTFDPGDLREMESIVSGVLSPQGVYDYVAVAKQKETLTPNLPLRYGIASLDGYDGGLLPLRSYVEMKEMFPLQGDGAADGSAWADGRLREQLATIPDPQLLGWLNVRYIVMDRTRDLWVEGVYYDTAITQTLSSRASIFTLRDLPLFSTTSVGILSYATEMETLPSEALLANVVVTDALGTVHTAELWLGEDTATPTGQGARRAKPPVARWEDGGTRPTYYTKVPLPVALHPKEVAIVYRQKVGQLHLRGLSLIDDRTQTSYPLVLSPWLRFASLGDVKIYENLAYLPRAFIVRQADRLAPGEKALDRMRQPGFDLARRVVLAQETAVALTGSGEAVKGEDSVTFLRYQPEDIVLDVTLGASGWLVLTDTFYPGWRAWVDGQEVPILRADHLFRALPLAAGRHLVQFRYEPLSFKIGALFSFLTLAATLAILVAHVRTLRSIRGQGQ